MFKRLIWLIAALMLVFGFSIRANVVQAQVSFGTNWFAEYFNEGNFNFAGAPVVTLTYPGGLNFNFGTNPPVAGVNAENWSARYTTTENFPASSNYEFVGVADDQIRVYIDGIMVYEQLTPGNFSFTRSLTAGIHALRVDLVQLTDVALLQFQWQTSTLPPDVTATPAGPVVPTGEVVNVQGLSLRTGPYLGASFIAVLRPGIAYPISGKNADEGGAFTWYQVTAGERVGWASGRYLTISGDAASIPTLTTVFQEIDNAPDVGVVATPRAVMNFRVRPSVRSARIGQIDWGEEVALIGRTVQAGENFWFQVRRDDGTVGWIFAPYVSVRGPIDAVPIR